MKDSCKYLYNRFVHVRNSSNAVKARNGIGIYDKKKDAIWLILFAVARKDAIWSILSDPATNYILSVSARVLRAYILTTVPIEANINER